MKKLLCLLLVCCMLPVFAACAGDDQPSPDDSSGEQTAGGSVADQTEEEPYYLETLPDNGYGEDVFRIMTIAGNIPLEANAFKSVVAKALYERDVALEDYYSIGIEYTTMQNDTSALADMRTAVQGGSGTFHAFITNAERLMTLAAEGLTEDLNNVENLSMEREWWNQSLNRNCSINGKLYCSAGPYSEYFYHAAFCLAYNKTMVSGFGMNDLYTLVLSGDWTLDAMYSMCTDYGVTQDNGDGVWDEKDRYSIAAFQVGMYGLFAGAGGNFSVTSDTGEIEIGLRSEESQRIIEKIISVFNSDSVKSDSVYNNYRESANLFTSGNALFLYTSTGYINDYLPSSQIDYGIIPLPKYDSNQTSYISCAWPASNFCVSVPTGKKPIQQAFTGLMLEAYCFLSYEIVRPVKYDSVLKFQVFHDPTASELLDLIFQTLYFDLNLVFDFGGSRTLVSDTIRKNTLGEYVSGYDGIVGEITDDINRILHPGQTD